MSALSVEARTTLLEAVIYLMLFRLRLLLQLLKKKKVVGNVHGVVETRTMIQTVSLRLTIMVNVCLNDLALLIMQKKEEEVKEEEEGEEEEEEEEGRNKNEDGK